MPINIHLCKLALTGSLTTFLHQRLDCRFISASSRSKSTLRRSYTHSQLLTYHNESSTCPVSTFCFGLSPSLSLSYSVFCHLCLHTSSSRPPTVSKGTLHPSDQPECIIQLIGHRSNLKYPSGHYHYRAFFAIIVLVGCFYKGHQVRPPFSSHPPVAVFFNSSSLPR